MYREAKIYYDGSHYIAIPHTERPDRKRHNEKAEEFVVEKTTDSEVSVRSKKELEGDLISIPQPEVMPFEVEETEPIKTVTRKSEFNRLYDESKGMSKDERKEFISRNMSAFFKADEDSAEYVELQIANKKRTVQARKLRFIRKAYMHDFNYFATFTYDDAKHTEESFRKKLTYALRHLVSRKSWKYMGVWERAPKTERLHFHGLLEVPDGGMIGDMITERSWSTRQRKMQTSLQNTYFNSKFGRSDFEKISKDSPLDYANAIAYILKYIEKTGEKIVYSRGLEMYLISDIEDTDVLTAYGIEDKKLLLFDNFNCWSDGEWLGVISKDVKALMHKTN